MAWLLGGAAEGAAGAGVAEGAVAGAAEGATAAEAGGAISGATAGADAALTSVAADGSTGGFSSLMGKSGGVGSLGKKNTANKIGSQMQDLMQTPTSFRNNQLQSLGQQIGLSNEQTSSIMQANDDMAKKRRQRMQQDVSSSFS